MKIFLLVLISLFLLGNNSNAQIKSDSLESLSIDWPDEENWKLGNAQENDKMAIIELIRNDDTINDWYDLVNMMSLKGVKANDLNKVMNMMYRQTKQNSPNAILTFIETNTEIQYPWIKFKIVCPSFLNDNKPESQLWYVVQGKTSLYTNFRAIKEEEITDEQVKKWSKIFESSKIVYTKN